VGDDEHPLRHITQECSALLAPDAVFGHELKPMGHYKFST
jgi:hypothetical protein